MHKLNFAVTSRTWSAAHASSRSFSGGSKTGLEKTAEIEPKQFVVFFEDLVGYTRVKC